MAPERTPWWRGARGEWYVVLQLLLLALVLLGPATLGTGPAWPSSIAPGLLVLGLVLVGAGLLLAAAGVLQLGRNLSPLPVPKSGAGLVTTGPYRLVRHPIYGGLILLAFGWALAFGGWLTFGSAIALFVLLERKAAREERRLLERFAEYGAYRRRTRKLLPFVFGLPLSLALLPVAATAQPPHRALLSPGDHYAHGKICYLEIPAKTAEASADFYRSIFGWTIRRRGDGELAFDDAGGGVSGTWVKESDRTPDERTRTYIMVDAIADSLKQIEAAGGRVLTPRTDIGTGMGAFAVFADPVGNEFGLYEEPRR